MAHAQSTLSPPFVSHAEQMLATHPSRSGLEEGALLQCVQACFDCAQTCHACADACLGESEPKEMVRCIRLNQDCADICEATGKLLTRQTAFEPVVAKAILQAAAIACATCADECERHGKRMEHCRVCADACRRCQASCEQLVTRTASA